MLALEMDTGVPTSRPREGYPSTAKLYFRLARPHFLIPGFMLYTSGYLLALTSGASWSTTTFFLGYIVLGTAHLSVSFSNDYFDIEADKESQPTPFSGGSKVLVNHPELRPNAIRIALALLALSFALALTSVFALSYPTVYLVFAMLGGLMGFFYSAPPLKFAYRGLGELITSLSVGIIMPGFGYLTAARTMGLPLYLFFIPMACYALFFILTVEIPDQVADAKAGKKTIVQRLGRKGSQWFAVSTNLLGSVTLLAIQQSQLLNPHVNAGAIALLSFTPLATSLFSAFTVPKENKTVRRMVMLNMTAILVLLLGADIVFLLAKP